MRWKSCLWRRKTCSGSGCLSSGFVPTFSSSSLTGPLETGRTSSSPSAHIPRHELLIFLSSLHQYPQFAYYLLGIREFWEHICLLGYIETPLHISSGLSSTPAIAWATSATAKVRFRCAKTFPSARQHKLLPLAFSILLATPVFGNTSLWQHSAYPLLCPFSCASPRRPT